MVPRQSDRSDEVEKASETMASVHHRQLGACEEESHE